MRRVDAGDAAEIVQNCRDLFAGELDLRHVAVARAHALGKPLLELFDGITEIDLPQGWRLWKRACPCRLDGMASPAMMSEDRLAVACIARGRRVRPA